MSFYIFRFTEIHLHFQTTYLARCWPCYDHNGEIELKIMMKFTKFIRIRFRFPFDLNSRRPIWASDF